MSKAPERKVAIVFGDRGIRKSLRRLLDVMGYLAETFDSATAFLNAGMQNVFCLILDNNIPGMTGLELAEMLRNDGADIPILLITDSPSPTISARATELGIKVFTKPLADYDLESLIDAAKA